VSHTDLLRRYSPYLQYDSFESFRCDSAATMPELAVDDGSGWSYTNALKRKGGRVIAQALPKGRQPKLELGFLGATTYANGAKVARSDYLDAVGRKYVADARRLHAEPRYADRLYGHVALEENGTPWLQYWFFYYYNDKSFLGIGLHEGDWEMIQLRLGEDGVPTAATFAQHNTGEAFAWKDLELRQSPGGPIPVVYVGRGSHASFADKGEHWPMFPVPPDYADGKGPRVRPKLEIVDGAGSGWVRWPGKWGSSDSSPRGPHDHEQWRDPAGFHREVGGTRRGRSTRAPVRTVPDLPAPPSPKVTVHRVDGRAVVVYEFPKTLRDGAARPERIAVSLDTPDDDLPPATQSAAVRAATGAVAHPMALEDDERYVVRVVAYSEDGVASKTVSAKVPAASE
jgi:hypothetical protein